jgi:tRNA(fMet)-specific endonuclease VapC
MKTYLLDTNACIDYLKGHQSVVEKIRATAPEQICISSVVLSELRYGAEKSARRAANHAALDGFLEEIDCLDLDSPAASAYGRLRVLLEAQGTPIGPNDLLIAAHALALGCILITDNERELKRVPGLRVENWRGGQRR